MPISMPISLVLGRSDFLSSAPLILDNDNNANVNNAVFKINMITPLRSHIISTPEIVFLHLLCLRFITYDCQLAFKLGRISKDKHD